MNLAGANTDGDNWDGFGNSISRIGSDPTAYGWGEESGYQTDNNSGLRLLGHRYYDSRTGRFISQDPAGDGDNWYAYCGNNPMGGSDPNGLSEGLPGQLGAPDQRYGGAAGEPGNDPGAFEDDFGLPGVFMATVQNTFEANYASYLNQQDAEDAAKKQAQALAELVAEANAISTDTPISGEGMDGVQVALGVAPKKDPHHHSYTNYDDWEIFHFANFSFSWQDQYDIAHDQQRNGAMLGGSGTVGASGTQIYKYVSLGAKAEPHTMLPAWILQFGGAGLALYGTLRMQYLDSHKY